MALSSLLTLAGIWFAVLVVPGPDIVQIIRVAPRSTRAGLACALGIASGTGVWIAGSLAGLSALIAARPGVLAFLQIAGGGFLVWMGANSIRAGLAARRAPAVNRTDITAQAVDAGQIADITTARAYRLGLMTNLSNPKALVFFGAVFAQFLTPGMSAAWTLGVGLIMLIISVCWFSLFALMVRAASRWLTKYSHLIDIVSGLIFVVLGLVMVDEGIVALMG